MAPGLDSPPNPAAVLSSVGEIVIEDRAVPTPAPDEVVVRVEAVGVCGSDVHYFQDGRIGSFVLEDPLILGHETAGTVVAAGDDVDPTRVGTRVAIEPGVPCGRCTLCRTGHYNLCPDVAFHATPPVDGTLQHYVAVRGDFAFALPDTVSTEEGALIEPLSVAVWACRKANVGLGQSVLITGAGPIGLLCLQVALAAGASRVVITDVDEARLELAASLGATATLTADRLDAAPEQFDVHLECSGSLAASRSGIQRLTRGGTAVLIGMGSSADLELPVSLIQERELVLTGTFRYANCYPAAIDLVATGRVQVAPLVTGRFPLAQTAEALQHSGRPGSVKTLILPHASPDSKEK